MKFKSLPKLYQWGVRFPKITLALVMILTALSIWGAQKLTIENDLTALLPKNFESVQALNELKKDFGGLGFLVVTVQDQDPEKAEHFADEMVRRVEALPTVQYVEYRRPTEFFKKRLWLYLDPGDLSEMERRVDRSLELEKKGYNPTFNHLMDFADEEDRPDLTFSDIRKKYEEKNEIKGDSYASDDEGKFIVLKVKVRVDQHQMDLNQQINDSIHSIEEEMKRDPSYQSSTVGYTGDNIQAIEQVKMIQKRMGWVSGTVTALLLLILLLYFRNLSGVFLVSLPLFMGVVWTGGLIYLLFGHLNILTGFAAGILAGLGSDYGIYLLTRYYQEREAGVNFELSCQRAFTNTGRATYGSMLTTVFAFLALLFSDFGVSKEFGVVGALGVFLNYGAMMLVIPALLSLGERARVKKGRAFLGSGNFSTNHPRIVSSPIYHAIFSPRGALLGVLLTLLLCGASAFTVPSQTVMHFEDGRMDPMALPGDELYHKAVGVLGGTLQPTALITKGVSEDEKTLKAFEEKLEHNPSLKQHVYRNVIGLSKFIPENVEEKKPILARLVEKFKKSSFPIKSKRDQLIESFQDSLNSPPVTAENLPLEVKRKFESPFAKGVYAVYVFPSFRVDNWEETKNYTETVLNTRKEAGLNFVAVDNPFVATEFVKMMEREGPRMVLTTLIFLLGVLLWIIKPIARSLITFSHLLAGLLLLSGTMWLLKIPLNTINIAAFPIILGTGIDSFIHFGLRFDETYDIDDTIQNKLPSVLVSNLTTIIGFAGLLFTPSAGLRSLGAVALLGLTIMTLLCAFPFPRCLVLETRKRIPSLKLKAKPAEA